jgi:hypothetical protein
LKRQKGGGNRLAAGHVWDARGEPCRVPVSFAVSVVMRIALRTGALVLSGVSVLAAIAAREQVPRWDAAKPCSTIACFTARH